MAVRFTMPRPQYEDNDGLPLVAGKLYFYATGGTTPKDTYSDAALTTPNTNPVILGAGGRPTVDIFLGSGNYRVVIKNSADETLETNDPVEGVATTFAVSEVSGRTQIAASGAATNIGLNLAGKGNETVALYSYGGYVLIATGVLSAVNYMELVNSATGNALTEYARGADTNIALNRVAKGTGQHLFYNGTSPLAQFGVGHTASAVNYIVAFGAATGTGPHLIPEGSDTNTALRLSAKGAAPVSSLMPLQLPTYTVATLPSAATYIRCLIYVSDGTANQRLAVSDGTNWRFPSGSVVS